MIRCTNTLHGSGWYVSHMPVAAAATANQILAAGSS